MTPVALGAHSSVSPLTTGKPVKHPCAAGGAIAFPGAGGFMVLDPSTGGSGYQTWWQAQLGPYNLPYRYWLNAGANWIAYSGGSWTRYDVMLRLLINAAAYGPDLNGQAFHQNADSQPGASVDNYPEWQGQSIEAKFFCEANTTYHVRFESQGGGGSVNYFQHPIHMNMWAYTVGEGVY